MNAYRIVADNRLKNGRAERWRRWKNNIKINLDCGDGRWTKLSQYHFHRWAVILAVLNLRVLLP
jgi:hypothetical protein